MDNQYVINRARELIAQHEQYRMTPTEAQAYLDADHSVGVWAGSPEGEQMRSHINNMTMCARYILWVDFASKCGVDTPIGEPDVA